MFSDQYTAYRKNALPLPTLTPDLSRRLAREEAYESLRSWIINGTLAPGETLRDQAIAETLKVSRTPVREALRRLEDEGFVETAHSRWTRVAPISITKSLGFYGVLEGLEMHALSLYSRGLTRAELGTMKAANTRMQKAIRSGSTLEAIQADQSFHDVFVLPSGNQELYAIILRVRLTLLRTELTYFGRRTRANDSYKEHQAILEAFTREDFVAVERAAKAHWKGCTSRLRNVTAG